MNAERIWSLRRQLHDRHHEAAYSEGPVHVERRDCWCCPVLTPHPRVAGAAIVQHQPPHHLRVPAPPEETS